MNSATVPDYKCTCGRDGFVDMGEKAKNRYPCKLCYYKKNRPDSAVVAMLEKEQISSSVLSE